MHSLFEFVLFSTVVVHEVTRSRFVLLLLLGLFGRLLDQQRILYHLPKTDLVLVIGVLGVVLAEHNGKGARAILMKLVFRPGRIVKVKARLLVDNESLGLRVRPHEHFLQLRILIAFFRVLGEHYGKTEGSGLLLLCCQIFFGSFVFVDLDLFIGYTGIVS